MKHYKCRLATGFLVGLILVGSFPLFAQTPIHPPDSTASIWIYAIDEPAVIAIQALAELSRLVEFGRVSSQAGRFQADGSEIVVIKGGVDNYAIDYHVSLLITLPPNPEVMTIPGIRLATPLIVSNATNTTPIVATAVNHGLLDGDIIEIAGVGGNDAANGSWLTGNVTVNTFELSDIFNAPSIGDGAFTTPGAVPIVYLSNLGQQRDVDSTTIGVMGSGGSNSYKPLNIGDRIGLYAANLTSAQDIVLNWATLTVTELRD